MSPPRVLRSVYRKISDPFSGMNDVDKEGNAVSTVEKTSSKDSYPSDKEYVNANEEKAFL